MKTLIALAAVFAVSSMALAVSPSPPEPAPSPPVPISGATPDFKATSDSEYGVFPIAWKEIIEAWMKTRLVDPKSAVFEWLGEPRPAEVEFKNKSKEKGYFVEFRVNSRSTFGNVTGWQKRWVLLRNGEVIKGTGFESVRPKAGS